MRTTDAKLLEGCRLGDESAWESIIKRYQRLIYAIPRRAGLDEDQAGDVFQEVFATLFRKLNDIDEPERLHAWLVTIARRQTWKLISRQKSWQQFGSPDQDEEEADELANIPDSQILPDEALMRLEEQHRIRTAVTALDERCRKLITMLFYQAEPPAYSEIAAVLGTSEGSIGPTRARCLGKMLRLLEKD